MIVCKWWSYSVNAYLLLTRHLLLGIPHHNYGSLLMLIASFSPCPALPPCSCLPSVLFDLWLSPSPVCITFALLPPTSARKHILVASRRCPFPLCYSLFCFLFIFCSSLPYARDASRISRRMHKVPFRFVLEISCLLSAHTSVTVSFL